METFAYLHTACAYEDPEAVTLNLPIDQSNVKQLSSQATLLMLQLLIPAAILAVAGHASALQVGDRGPSVTTLQDRLRSTGYFNRSSTGVYASITADAVRRFQASRGLVVDGIAGPATQRALRGQSYAASGNIRPISSTTYDGDTIRPIANTGGLQCSGSSVISVRDLQRRLNDRGYSVGIDGIFGSETCRALRQFQAANGLVVDGIPGPATRTALGLSSPNLPGGGNGSSASVRKRYVVVVPAKSSATLSQVRTVVPDAVYSATNLGKYIQAGAFDERGFAESRATLLRANRLDAQVRYF